MAAAAVATRNRPNRLNCVLPAAAARVGTARVRPWLVASGSVGSAASRRGAPAVPRCSVCASQRSLSRSLSLSLSLFRSLYLCRAFPAQPRCYGSAAPTDAPPLPLPCAVATPSLGCRSAVAPLPLGHKRQHSASPVPLRLASAASSNQAPHDVLMCEHLWHASDAALQVLVHLKTNGQENMARQIVVRWGARCAKSTRASGRHDTRECHATHGPAETRAKLVAVVRAAAVCAPTVHGTGPGVVGDSRHQLAQRRQEADRRGRSTWPVETPRRAPRTCTPPCRVMVPYTSRARGAHQQRGGADEVDPREVRAGMARGLIWRCRRRSVTERGQINGPNNRNIFNIFIL